MLGMVNFAAALPMLALSMYAGTVADKYDKRKILVLTNVVQIVLAVLLGWLVMTHRVQIWHVLVGAAAGVSPARSRCRSASALVPELVDRETHRHGHRRGPLHLSRHASARSGAGRVVHGGAAGDGLGVLRQRHELPGDDRRPVHHRPAHPGHGRRRRNPARHRRHEGGHRLRQAGPPDDGHARVDGVELAVHFPVHGGDDAALRQEHAGPGRAVHELADERVGHRLAGGVDGGAERAPAAAAAEHDRGHGGHRARAAGHVGGAEFLAGGGGVGGVGGGHVVQLRAGQHHRAGTRAGADPGPRVGVGDAEFRGRDAVFLAARDGVSPISRASGGDGPCAAGVRGGVVRDCSPGRGGTLRRSCR